MSDNPFLDRGLISMERVAAEDAALVVIQLESLWLRLENLELEEDAAEVRAISLQLDALRKRLMEAAARQEGER